MWRFGTWVSCQDSAIPDGGVHGWWDPDRRTESVFGELQLQAKVNLHQSLCELHGGCRIAEIQLPIVADTARRLVRQLVGEPRREAREGNDKGVSRRGRGNKRQGAEEQGRAVQGSEAGILPGELRKVRLGLVQPPKVAVGRHAGRRRTGPTGIRPAELGSAGCCCCC